MILSSEAEFKSHGDVVPVGEQVAIATAVGLHQLPDLPYAYDALEPHIDERTMRLHHQNHHGGAVRGLNRTEKALVELSKSGDFASTRKLCRDLAYYGSSHVLQ